jgi:hypothetical protein
MLRQVIQLAASVLIAGFAIFARVEAAGFYDLANDFSPTVNGGSNLWGYGVYTGGLTPSTYTAFTTTASAFSGALDVWSFGGDPNLEKNVTSSPLPDGGCCGGITWPANEVAFGPFNGPTVARWTAPVTSLYDISATFTPIQNVNTSPNGYVYLGSTQLTNLTLSNTPGVGTSFTDNLVLIHAGQTLDFVAWGNNSNNKTTEVQASITAVPEPASVTLSGLSGIVLAGVGLIRRRARSAA